MWNNDLKVIVKFSATQKVKWNKSTHARRHFTLRSNISRTKCISQIPQGIYFVEKREQVFRLALFFLAPPAGLEPATTWLTVRCSTDWAKEDCPRLLIFPVRRQTSIFSIAELNFCVRNGYRWTLCIIDTNYFFNAQGFPCASLCPLFPIFPVRRQTSIFGIAELNFCVRNGYRWTLSIIRTNFWCTFRDSNPGPTD